MSGDRDLAELANDMHNRPMEAVSRVRIPNLGRAQQSRSGPANQVKVNLSEGARYQKLYTQYAQGVEAASPVNKTLAVARNAARDGQPTDMIVSILRNDSKAQQFGDRSEKFIQTVAQSAIRKTQAEFAQTGRQHQKTPTLER